MTNLNKLGIIFFYTFGNLKRRLKINIYIMFEYIFTIGCFDKLHKGHIKLLEGMRKNYCRIT